MSTPTNSALMGNAINRRKHQRKRTPELIQQDVDLVRAYIENGGKITKLPAAPTQDSNKYPGASGLNDRPSPPLFSKFWI